MTSNNDPIWPNIYTGCGDELDDRGNKCGRFGNGLCGRCFDIEARNAWQVAEIARLRAALAMDQAKEKETTNETL